MPSPILPPAGNYDPGGKHDPADKHDPAEQGMLKKSLSVSALTMASRVLGLVRDMILAWLLGAGATADAFFVAFKLPNFVRRLVAEGAFSQALVPVLLDYRRRQAQQELQQLLSQLTRALLLVLLGLGLLLWLLSPWLLLLLAPGYHAEPEQWRLTLSLFRWLLPYLLLSFLVAYASALLHSLSRFILPACMPLILNLSMIAAALLLLGWLAWSVHALALAVVLAGLLQLLVQLPALKRAGILPAWRTAKAAPSAWPLLRAIVPALMAVSLAQVLLLLDTILATLLQQGAVSWLYYADRLLELPQGLIAVALSIVILPVLSQAYSSGDQSGFKAVMAWSMRLVALLGVPAALALYYLALPIMATLFMYGVMTASDIQQSAKALQGYSLGLLAMMLLKVLLPAAYAAAQGALVRRSALYALLLALALKLSLMQLWGHLGLALATSVGLWCMALLLSLGLAKQALLPSFIQVMQSLVRPILASLVMLLLLHLWLPEADWWLAAQAGSRIGLLSLAVALGAGCYVLLMLLLGFRWSWLRFTSQS